MERNCLERRFPMFPFPYFLRGVLLLGGVVALGGASPAQAQSKTVPGLATGWTQIGPYNAACPKNPAGVPARTGSAALALAQLLRFGGLKFNFPPSGIGSHTDVDKTPDVAGSFSANFGATFYNWSSMPPSLKTPDADVSTILLQAGIALDTDYGTGGSFLPKFNPTAGFGKPADAAKVAQGVLVKYFGWTGGTVLFNSATTGAVVPATLDKIKADINAGYPVIAVLTGTSGGQFAVVNGYNGNKLNFLFGLGGGDGAYETGKIVVKYKDAGIAQTATFNGVSAFLVGARPPVAPSVSVGDASVVEGNSGTVKLRFPVSISAKTKFPVSVALKTSKGTATPKTDYSETSGIVVVPAGKTSAFFEVPVIGDFLVEKDETLFASASAGKLKMLRAKATGTIKDDDTTASLADLSVVEGNSGPTPVTVTLSLGKAIATPLSFSYSTTAGTATADSDFTAASGTVTVPKGATSIAIPLVVLGDTTKEADETFTLQIASSAGAAISKNTATITILNDDLTVSVSDASVIESDFGHPKADFVLTLEKASAAPITVTYATQNGTAESLNDYDTTTGSVIFAPGETSKTVSVGVSGDKREEADETFQLLASSTQVGVARQGTATVQDDDASLVVTPSVQVTEGQAVPAISVGLSRALSIPVKVNYATADSNATAGSDYTAANGTLSFAPGGVAQTLSLQSLDDTAGEGSELFVVNFNSLELEESATTQVTVLDNDAAITATAVKAIEGDTQSRNLTFNVTLSNAYSQRVSVAYTTIDGTAKAGVDYQTTTGILVFEPGDTNRSVDVPIIPDSTPESDETLGLQLTSSDLPAPSAPLVGTIQDDDFALTVENVSTPEGNSGITNATFTVKLSKAVSFPVDVNFAVSEGTAKFSTDFDQKNVTLNFAAGDTQKTVDVSVFGDTVDEPDETYTISATTSYSYPYDDGRSATATGTIVDDDVPTTPLIGRIVFLGRASATNQDDVFIANPDGTNLTRLTFTGDIYERRPMLSPDGTKIVFSDGSAVYSMDTDGRNAKNLGFFASDYRWSSDGTKLVYTSGGDVYVVNADGTNKVQLTTTGSNSDPQFSPDGTKILFESSIDSHTDLFTILLTGRSQTRLTRNGAENARFNPAGTQIVFNDYDGSDDEIYIINSDGTGLTALTGNVNSDTHPRWNIDGTKIFFLSSRTGTRGIYSMGADGTSQTLLVREGNLQSDVDIVLSPNGGYLAYATYDNSTNRTLIRLLELITNGQTRDLPTPTLSIATQPTWGTGVVPAPPTGLPIGALTGKIVFDGYGSSSGIKIENADGTNVRSLNTNGYLPVFSPDGSRILYRAGDGLSITDTLGNTVDTVDGDVSSDTSRPEYVVDATKTHAYYADHGNINVTDLTTGVSSTLVTVPENANYGYNNAYPMLSADGTRVIFQTYYGTDNGSQTDIASVPVGGGGVTYLTNDGGSYSGNYLGASNPISGKIAFNNVVRDPNTGETSYQVTLMNADGTNRQVSLVATKDIFDMTFSPDGSKMAVALINEGGVFAGAANGTPLSKVFDSSYRATVRFEPNSAHLGVSDYYQGFWVMKPDGSDRLRLSSVGRFDWKAGTVAAGAARSQATPAKTPAKVRSGGKS